MSENGRETQSPGARDGSAGLDSVDACRLRLMSLRARIETNWPHGGGLLRRRGPRGEESDTIARLMAALPSPLPLAPGGVPQPLVTEADPDARTAAGRAVDAAMALLEADSLDATYPGRVAMMGGLGQTSNGRTGAKGGRKGETIYEAEPIEVAEPTVGLLVATIIGTLEAVSERLIPIAGGRDVRDT